MADPVNPFDPQTLEQYKAFFQPPPRKGLPTAEELETERSGLASFLGTTDYAQQLAEDRQLSKLQLGLALAQRGFGSMGAQPRPGEMAISTVGRELLSPLAGDAGAIATQMLQQRRALKAAQQQEERQLKLAALERVQTRQSQEYEDDLEATRAARESMRVAEEVDAEVSNDYTVDGINKPVIVITDRLGNVTFWDTNKQQIDSGRIEVYTAPVDPTISKSLQTDVYFNYTKVGGAHGRIGRGRGNVQVLTDDDGNQVLRVIGQGEDVDSGDVIEAGTLALNFEKVRDDPSTLYYNDGPNMISFIDPQGRPVQIAPGRFSPVSLKKSVHDSLPREDRSQLREWQEALPGGTVPKPYRNVSGVPQDLSFLGRGIIPPDQIVRITDGEFALLPPQLKSPEFFAAEPTPDIKHNVMTQVFDMKSGGYSHPQPATRVTKLINGVPTIEYFVPQEPGGAMISYGVENAREVVATHHPYKPTEILFVTPEGAEKLQNIIPGIKAGEEVQVFTASAMSGKGGTDTVEYRYAGEKVQVGAIAAGTNLFQTSPLSPEQRVAAGLDPVTWTAKEDLRVPVNNLEEIRKIPGLSGITANETLRVEEDESGNWRFLRGGEEIALTSEQQNLFVQRELEDAVTWTNTSTQPITINERPIPAGGTALLTRADVAQLDPAIRDVLVKAAPVSLAEKSFMVGGNKLIEVSGGAPGRPDRVYAPGDEIRGNDAEIAALLETAPGLNLVTSEIGKSRAVRGNWFRNYYKTFLKEEGLVGNDLTDQQVDTLFSSFPGTRSMNVAALRTQLFKFAKGIPLTVTEVAVAEGTKAVDKSLSDYQRAVQRRHSGAEARYQQLFDRGAVAIPWDQLSFQKREAFSSIAPRDTRLLDPETVGAAISEAEEALQKEKGLLASPDAADLSEFATKARLVSILKYIKDEDLLNNTGIIKGLFYLLGSSLSDWPVVGSKKAGKLSSMLQQLGANLKILEAGEARPSNWRLQLIQATLPEFTTAEFINNKNLEQAILLLENDMMAQLDPSLQISHVITPQLLAIAAEAGIKVPDIDHSKQRWLDPAEQPEPIFTRQGFLAAVGTTRFTHFDFERIYPGREVDLVDKNNPNARWLKVDDETEGLTLGNYYVIRTTDGKTAAPGATVQDITNLVPRGD